MSGEIDLDRLLASMQPELLSGVFVFATLTGPVPDGLTPVMVFCEAEGTTLILSREQAREWRIAHEFPCRMITLNVHSSLGAVGFLARVTTALARVGIATNPVAGFYHDHIFVPEDRAEEAMDVLRGMAG